MQPTVVRLRSLIIGLLAVYLFIYPVSLLLLALDRVPASGTWMGGAMLILLGVITALWLIENYGRRGLLTVLIILVVSWVVEHLGATTGFPFGSYAYTTVLQPQIIGIVPLAIPFAWVLVIASSMGATNLVVNSEGTPFAPLDGLSRVLTTASFALLLDITIEPFAVHINHYWLWDYRGGYYDIPASNFISWWVLSFIFAWVLRYATRTQRVHQPTPAVMPWLPLLLYMLNLTLFVIANLAHSQGVAAILGSLIMAYLAFIWLRPRMARPVPSASQPSEGDA